MVSFGLGMIPAHIPIYFFYFTIDFMLVGSADLTDYNLENS
ncbi:hypothetical protein [Moorena sp. SIO4G3]|nr:hypothetical protein [Moorena sp. SIO4G3]